ncbi:transposase [Streptomyces sp. NPDC059467]|uniref:transposase n=1 Tax=Streptomyces sp. NPDC059467 TaxID=3346844 RepID=UPI00367B0CA4
MTDRDAAKEVLFRLRLMHPEITIVGADSGYAGKLVTWARTYLDVTLKTVSHPKNTTGFVILPRRWVVERSLAWIMHARRHARDYERLIQHSESLITWAAITLMTRHITHRTSRRSGPPASREAHRDRSFSRSRSATPRGPSHHPRSREPSRRGSSFSPLP